MRLRTVAVEGKKDVATKAEKEAEAGTKVAKAESGAEVGMGEALAVEERTEAEEETMEEARAATARKGVVG